MTENDSPFRGEFVTIKRRGKKGIWTADFQWLNKHKRKTLRTKNARLARKRAAKLDRQLAEAAENGDQALDDILISKPAKAEAMLKITMTDAISQFTTYCETEGCRKRTVTKYRGILNRFADFAAIKNVQHLQDIDVPLIDRYRALRKPHLAAKSMHHDGATIKLFMTWAKSRGHITANPLAEIRYTPPKLKPKGGPTLDQVNAILAACPARELPILALLAFTGARSGEGARALVVDVDFERNWFYIISRPGAETKSGEDRKVPLHPRLRAILDALPRRKAGYFFTAEPSKKYPAGGHHISNKRLNESLVKLMKSLGIPTGRFDGFTTHSLRHFFRTFCVNAGVPERVVDIWLGHASDKTMGSVYYKLSDEQSQEFMKKIPFGDGKPAADAGEEGG